MENPQEFDFESRHHASKGKTVVVAGWSETRLPESERARSDQHRDAFQSQDLSA